jgi:hypothetical protein
MKHRIIDIAGVVLFLGILSAGCGKSSTTVFSNSTSSTTTPLISPSNNTHTLDMNSASSLSANGLNLSLSTDSTTYHANQAISIVIDETNTLSTTNDVPATGNLPSNDFAIDTPNQPTIFPFGIAVFRGEYTSLNYSTGIPLVVFNPSDLYGGTPVVGPTSYSFHPLSDIANIESPSYLPNSLQLIKDTLTLDGYWPNQDYGTQLIPFGSGTYTVVAGDEWGTLVIVHFTVTK